MASPSMSGFQRQPPYMWTKLRPGVHAFLQLAAQLFELHVCTMGDRTYAEQMVALLDPRRVLFADRIVSSVRHPALLALFYINYSASHDMNPSSCSLRLLKSAAHAEANTKRIC